MHARLPAGKRKKGPSIACIDCATDCGLQSRNLQAQSIPDGRGDFGGHPGGADPPCARGNGFREKRPETIATLTSPAPFGRCSALFGGTLRALFPSALCLGPSLPLRGKTSGRKRPPPGRATGVPPNAATLRVSTLAAPPVTVPPQVAIVAAKITSPLAQSFCRHRYPLAATGQPGWAKNAHPLRLPLRAGLRPEVLPRKVKDGGGRAPPTGGTTHGWAKNAHPLNALFRLSAPPFGAR